MHLYETSHSGDHEKEHEPGDYGDNWGVDGVAAQGLGEQDHRRDERDPGEQPRPVVAGAQRRG